MASHWGDTFFFCAVHVRGDLSVAGVAHLLAGPPGAGGAELGEQCQVLGTGCFRGVRGVQLLHFSGCRRRPKCRGPAAFESSLVAGPHTLTISTGKNNASGDTSFNIDALRLIKQA